MTRTRTSARRPLLAGSAVALLALVAACGGTADVASDDTTAAAAPSPSATAEPSAEPAPSGTGTAGDDAENGAAAPDFGTTGDGEASADALLTVTGVRLGTHTGFDRVVVDLGGTGTPGWHVERTPAAVEDPTGETIDLGGTGALTVYVTGLGYPHDTGVEELDPGTRGAGGTVVTGTQYSGTFEAQAQVFLGLTDPEAPYRAFLLRDPLRLVVDVQRSMA